MSADQSPESLVTCLGGGNFQILSKSISEPISAEQCKTWAPDQVPDSCAPCITSLEDQGCKVIDVVVTNLGSGEGINPVATYMLSCVTP